MLAEDYIPVALLTIIAVSFPIMTFFMTRYVRPRKAFALRGASSYVVGQSYVTNYDTDLSNETYECGAVPLGEAQIQFHFQYYMYAIIFLVFDVVTMFLIIWGLFFSFLTLTAKIFMLLFLGLMLGGVTYVLNKEETIWI